MPGMMRGDMMRGMIRGDMMRGDHDAWDDAWGP